MRIPNANVSLWWLLTPVPYNTDIPHNYYYYNYFDCDKMAKMIWF